MDVLRCSSWSYSLLRNMILRAGMVQLGACMIVSIWTPVHAGIAGGVRGEEDIDPLRTPWVYFDDGIPGIGCRASAQEIIDAYIAVKESADDICAVAYVDNDGWPTNPDAGSQWKNERCDPPESSILDGYNLTVWSAKPVVRQSARYYFTQTITRDYCPVNMFNIDVDHVFSRVLYRYCPVGYNLRVELVDGVPDWSRYFCTRGIDAPERDQEGSCLAVGMMDGDNPVYLGSGNKRQLEADYVDARDPRFTLARHYNSMRSIYLGVPEAIGLFGVNWSSTYERSVRFVAQPSSTTVQLYRDDGDVYYFQYQNGVWKSNSAVNEQLIQAASGWEYHTAQDHVEIYNMDGNLTELRYPNGVTHFLSYDVHGLLRQVRTNTEESLTFAYDEDAASPLVKSLQDHTGRIWQYAYDQNNNLVSVTGPDGTPEDAADNPVRIYHYEDASLPNALTGITDERGIRYATFAYDPDSHVRGRAVTSYYGSAADSADRVDVDYNGQDTYSDGTTVRSVTNNEGGVTTYTTIMQHGVALLKHISGPGCSNCSGGEVGYSYDPETNDLLLRTENGVTTEFGNYDSNGNPGYMIVARGTADERRIDYSYDPRYFSKIASVSESSVYSGGRRVTSYEYDDYGNRVAERIDGFTPDGSPVSRMSRYQYDGPYHQLSQIDGPRNDVNDITSFRYYPDDPGEGVNRARLREVENASGDLVRSNIRYTPTGKVAAEDRSNQVSLLYSYYPGNDRLEYLHENTTSGVRSTHWTYLESGEVEQITVAEGDAGETTLMFGYDDARRLVRITDGAGNYIHYTLDSHGNHLAEEIYDANGTPQDEVDDVLAFSLAQTFDAYNRMDLKMLGTGSSGPLEIVDLDYLQNASLDRKTDGNGTITNYSYDSLQRLIGSTRDTGGVNAVTGYAYDAGRNLSTVTDANNVTTTYIRDDLGNLLSISSPDTGTTLFTYDDAGNLVTKTVASGTPEAVTLAYRYDALNRLIQVTTPNPAEDVGYIYDDCVNGVGHVCEISNGHTNVFYQYDGFGNISAHQGIRFTHDAAGRLQSLEYPSGNKVRYAYDAAGRVSGVDMTRSGLARKLASSIKYLPFGGMQGMMFGNDHVLTQHYDTAYRLVRQLIPSVQQLDYVDYDGNGNLMQLDATDAGTAVSNLYIYDSLDRIDSAAGAFGSGWNYDYDRNGNRTMGNEGEAVILRYEANSNRLNQIGSKDVILDVAGNTLAKGTWNYSYTVHQRLHTAGQSGNQVVDYAYNGLGQRIYKNISASIGRRFLYGTDGKLLVEMDWGGSVLMEYIWLNGEVLAVYHPDTDNDGITNLQELEQGGLPANADDDGDGLSNIDELLVYGTSPGIADFDGDGASDGEEVTQGADPRDPDSHPFTFVTGDINLDGRVDVADYLLLTRFVLGYRTPSVAESQSADMNHDGELNAGDLVLLTRVLLSTSWNSLVDHSFGRQLSSVLEKLIAPVEASVTSGKLYYVHNDHLGTPQAMTGETGQVVWSAAYTPFGEAVIDAASTVTLNLRFPGQYYDQETGIHYNYFRYYDPKTGRYMRSDPNGVLLEIHDPQRQVAAKQGISMPAMRGPDYFNHRYNYVDNNPVNRTDPTGEIDPVTAGAIIWSFLYFTHAGDAISDPNGNVWGEPDRQDNVCTLGPILGPIGDVCFPERCQRHDNCFAKNRCTASSWISSMLGGTKPCNQCNSGFFK